MIRVYAVGGHRLTVLPHTPESDIRDEAVSLARQEGADRVLVIDREPTGDETVVESIALPVRASSAASPLDGSAVAEAQRIAADAASGPRDAAAL